MKAFREPFRLKPPEVNSRPGGQGGVVAVAEPPHSTRLDAWTSTRGRLGSLAQYAIAVSSARSPPTS